MLNKHRVTLDTPVHFRLRVQGSLDEHWSDRLGDATISRSGTPQAWVTELSGTCVDQAAVFGILNTLYDLGLPPLSNECAATPSAAGG